MLELNRLVKVVCNLKEGLCAFALRVLLNPVASDVLTLLETKLHWDSAKEWKTVLFTEVLSTISSKDWDVLVAIRADEIAHVLDDTKDLDGKLVCKGNASADILDGDLLWGCHDDGTGEVRHGLADGKLLITGSWRGIDEKIIQCAPLDIGQELLDDADFHRSAEDDCLIRIVECEAHAHDLKSFARTDWKNMGTILCGTENLSLATEHLGDVWSVDICIKDSNGMALSQKCVGKVYGDSALSNTTLSTHDQNLAVDLAHGLVDLDFLKFIFIWHVLPPPRR